MDEPAITRPHMVVRRFTSHAEQEAEDIRHWNACSIEEKMRATIELVEYAERLRGAHVDRPRSTRSIVRLQRARG